MKLSHSTLPSAAAQILVAQLDEALAEREILWRDVLSGTEDAMQEQPTPPCGTPAAAPPDDSDRDEEHFLACKRMKIQGIITACVDTGIQKKRVASIARERGLLGAHTRLAELGAAEVPHLAVAAQPPSRTRARA